MPGLVGGFGNYLLPIHCGSPDMAKLNLGSIYYKIGAAKKLVLSLNYSLLPCTSRKITGTLAQKKHPLSLSPEPLPTEIGLQLVAKEGKGIKSMEEQQPIKEIGESETPQAIQASQSQIEAKVQDPKYKKLNSYLAGLFEGDGHIWLPNLNMKKKHNPRFCITFGLKNEPLAKKLLQIIEYGHIRYKPKENACVLIVSPVKGLKKIIKLINGELRTPKIHQLHKLID
jgi:hypothetical protein